MPSSRPSLAAAHRDITGKAVAHLRKAGKLPAVVYGHGVASTNVTIDAHDFEQLRRRTGPNTLIDLAVDGSKANPVLISDVQLHRVTQRPLHADLFLVRMTEELTVDVPLVASGESEAVNTHGGTLLHPIEHVRVKALPDHLPQSIQYDISSLATFDDVIRLRELVIPADVTASEPRTHTTRFSGTVVVSVVIARAYGAALGRTTLCSRVFRQYLCGHEAAQGNAGA